MRNVEFQVMEQFLNQGIPSDPEERKRIASMKVALCDDPLWSIRVASIKTSSTFLSWAILPDHEKLDIVHKIAEQISVDNRDVGREAAKIIENFLLHSDFPEPNKFEVMRIIAEKLPHISSIGKKHTLRVLWTAVQAGLPVDFDILNKYVVNQVSEPAPAGPMAEKIVRTSLYSDGNRLSGRQRELIGRELKERVSVRKLYQRQQSKRNIACQKAVTVTAKRVNR